jgi:hypothetical protein
VRIEDNSNNLDLDVLLYDRNDSGATVKKAKVVNNKVTFKDSKVWNKVQGKI